MGVVVLQEHDGGAVEELPDMAEKGDGLLFEAM